MKKIFILLLLISLFGCQKNVPISKNEILYYCIGPTVIITSIKINHYNNEVRDQFDTKVHLNREQMNKINKCFNEFHEIQKLDRNRRILFYTTDLIRSPFR